MTMDRRRFLALSAASAAAGALVMPEGVTATVGEVSDSAGATLAPCAPLTPGTLHGAAAQTQGLFLPVRRNVGIFSLRGGTVGTLVNEAGVAVVDTQFADSAEALVRGLREQSNGRRVDLLVNTHHHGDHTGGNGVLRPVTTLRVAHAMAVEHLRNPPAGNPAAEELIPEVTFETTWEREVGDEKVVARHLGRAHTSGDAVVTFEAANVAHMGDLMFHRRHPVVDGPAGATLRGWMRVLEQTVDLHARDTVYIFGHADPGLPVTGSFTDLLRFRDYLDGVLTAVDRAIRAGQSREGFIVAGQPLAGFEDFGPFGQPGPREVRSVAWDELTQAG
jgi:cyclase